ncbi:Retrotransposon-derived protein PEG10 [Anabarilius grahami]|uniref:Retrotransposon-derived protein PEG10 n=1 Tax=Anabarilius grahami TaxID=495550 RepID=A0A3N0XL04_ANAGA|nr:Retrotransposon-derived protein PEG10 [Anabarilius grahami]
MQQHLYPNDTAKIAFLISQLRGKALKWADSIWSQHGAITQSYSSFTSHFREVFGKPITDSSAALITSYRQGLEPRVRLHLAAYEDNIGLEKFIQLFICCATRMQACIQEHQGQSFSTSLLCRSEPVSSPEPANEPMEVENSRLTPTERHRRLTLNLCLYCGTPGHVISACPTRPPRPMVSAILPSTPKMKPLTTVVNLTAADTSLTVVALLDSGSASNFISGALCRQLRLKTAPSPTIYLISSITGKPLSRKHVRRMVGPLQLQVGLLHTEGIHLLVLEDSTADVVLGQPLLEQHNPTISWKSGEILKWGEACFSNCISELPIPRAPSNKLPVCTTSIENAPFSSGPLLLLVASPREQEMAEEEVGESTAPLRPPYTAYTELLEVMECAAGRLQLPWERVRKEPVRGRLDEWFLSDHNPATPGSLPFLPDLHVEIERAWKTPYSAQIYRHQRASFAEVEGLGQYGYTAMPPIDETFANYLATGRKLRPCHPRR